ncbi:hypothetical protein BIV25_09890 [Streptomyces sp. MUSC 14]|nr:hypothetical protein BIV25_09890 [Streptomyces sp. MUSC 14]
MTFESARQVAHDVVELPVRGPAFAFGVFPLATSGARQRGLPRTVPVVVCVPVRVTSLHRTRAIPKSVSRATPASVTRTFSGVTSPCTTPSSWDFVSAAAI